MKLIGFSIADDIISLQRGADRFDLHNNFDFIGLSFDAEKRAVELKWRRGSGEWVDATQPEVLCLSFAEVHLLKVSERDPEIPFTEDACLSSIGFMWDDLVDEMRAFTSNQRGEGCTHLTATFMSGFCVKVGAASASLQASGGA